MKTKISWRKLMNYWFEYLIIIIIILSLIFYSFNPNIVTFLSFMSYLVIILIKSFKESQRKIIVYKIILNNLEEIFIDIHFYQNIAISNERILEKFDNLEKNFREELREIHCFIENIEGSKAIVIYFNDEKAIAQPGKRIERKSKNKTQFLDDHRDIEELMEENRKTF